MVILLGKMLRNRLRRLAHPKARNQRSDEKTY